jgi:tetratricopeptide (TPR) repeat protein
MEADASITLKSIHALREEWGEIPSFKFRKRIWEYAKKRFIQYLYIPMNLPNKPEILYDAIEKAGYVLGDLPVGSLEETATFSRGGPICSTTLALWAGVHSGDPLASILENISKEYKKKAQETGDIEFLDMAIEKKETMLSCFEIETETWAHCAYTLAAYFEDRFLWAGNEDDLERAFELSIQAVSAESPECKNLAIMLDGLATKNGHKFERTRDASFLDEAKRLSGQAIHTMVQRDAENTTDLARFWHHKSIIFHLEFSHYQTHSSLNESVLAASEAVKLAGKNKSSLHPKMLDNLAQRLLLRFNSFGSTEDTTDLDNALGYSRQAVESTPDHQPDWPKFLNTLALTYSRKYDTFHELRDLDTAVEFAQLATDHASNSEVESAKMHLNLANMYRERSIVTHSVEDLTKSIRHYDLSARVPTAGIHVRIQSVSRAGLLYAERGDWPNARSRLETSVDLLRQFSSRFLSQEDQQEILKDMGGLSSVAASVILEDGGKPLEALHVLEEGRCIISSWILDSRVDLFGLVETNEELYQRYTKLVDSWSMSPSAMEDGITGQPSAYLLKRQGIARAIEETEEEIRQQPGFAQFRLRKKLTDFKKLAEAGPIVSFNATEIRSDAFIVTTAGVEILNLPTLKYEDLAGHVRSLTGENPITHGSFETLPIRNQELCGISTWLWIHAVGPVLDRLDLKPRDNSVQGLPRVCWVTNGLLGMTPLHAAALDALKRRQNAMSLVSSSYVSSFQTLAHSMDTSLATASNSRRKVLMVAMPKTTGFSGELEVLSVREPLKRIVESFGNWDFKMLDTPSKAIVLDELKTANMVIFACHGVVDSVNLSNSGMLLKDDADGSPERLTFADLSHLSLKHVRLACLFACSTAELSCLPMRDEILHVTQGFHVAGLPCVIGTLWPVDDDSCNAALIKFFEAYFHCDHGESVTNSFQTAVNKVRLKSNGRGIRPDLLSWAPFVNFGHCH